MNNKLIKIDGREFILTHVATPTVNGGRCNQYEVREEREDAYHQFGDIYVPAGRSVQEHMEWWLDTDDKRTFAEWSKARRFGDMYAA